MRAYGKGKGVIMRIAFKMVKFHVVALIAVVAWQSVSAFSEGYVLSAAFSGSTTELFDNEGNVIFTWDHTGEDRTTATNGYSCYLLQNGNLLRGCKPSRITVSSGASPQQGCIQEVDPDGNVLWSDTMATTTRMSHHDFKPLPNGNVLCVAFVNVSKEEALAAGLDSILFSGSGGMFGGSVRSIEAEMIYELKPDRTGGNNHEIVWEWYLLDHVTPKENARAHPELFSGYMAPLYFSTQLVHLNGIDYNPVKDLIVFSSRVFSEIYVLDHSTTTQEAAGHTGGAYGKGGDILYRWGHPSNYILELKYDTVYTEADTIEFGDHKYIIEADTTINLTKTPHAQDYVNCLHCPTWIPEGYVGAGNVLFFHNNDDENMMQLGNSQAIEVSPDVDGTGKFVLTPETPAGPSAPTWIYDPDESTSMYSASMSTAIRMKNGNTLIHEAYPGGNNSGNSGTVREVNREGVVVSGPSPLMEERG